MFLPGMARLDCRAVIRREDSAKHIHGRAHGGAAFRAAVHSPVLPRSRSPTSAHGLRRAFRCAASRSWQTVRLPAPFLCCRPLHARFSEKYPLPHHDSSVITSRFHSLPKRSGAFFLSIPSLSELCTERQDIFRPLKCFWFAKIFYRFSPFRSLGQSLTDRRVYMVFAHAGKNAQKNTGSSESYL